MGKVKKCGVKEDLSGIIERFENIQLLDKVVHAPTLESQISALKEFPKSLPTGQTFETEALFSVLFQIILKFEVKNPLRITCINVLRTVPEDYKSVLDVKFKEVLKELLTAKLDIANINNSINFMSSWNVTESQLCAEIFNYLKRALEECMGKLRTEEGPQHRLHIIDCVHNCVRCAIMFRQKMPNLAVEKVHFKGLTRAMIQDNQLPLNVRSNSAILLVLSFETYDFDEIREFMGELDAFSELFVIFGPLSLGSSGDLTLSQSDLETLLGRIMSLESRNSVDCQLLLLSSRCMRLAVKCLSQTPRTELLQAILNIIWCHLEHFMDSVRHLGINTLNNLVEVGLKEGNRAIIHAIKSQIMMTPPERRAKHVGISSLVGHVPINDLIGGSDGLASSLLEAASCNAGINHAISSLEALMVQHYKECDQNVWFQYWCEPILDKIKCEGLNAGLERILTAAVRTRPETMDKIAELSRVDDRYVCAFLTCAKVAIKYDLSPKSQTLTQLLNECVYNANDEVRMSCFALITESRKSSEVFSGDDLNIVKLLVFYNFDNNNAAIMQRTIAYFKKFIARFKESRLKLLKEKSNPTLVKYQEFLDWLFRTSYDNLDFGASYPRRKTTLAILDLCADQGFCAEVTQERACALMTLLSDPYEENKLTAKKLLKLSGNEHLKDPDFVKSYLDKALKMAAGIRPTDTATAAYFIGLLADSPGADFTLLSIDSILEENFSAYACVFLTINKLKRDKQVAEQSLLKAASTGPLYGLIHVIRHLLNGVDFRSLKSQSDISTWRWTIEDLLDLLFDCNRLLTPIVNSASPEGHLPMDLDYDVSFLDESTPNVTSQMVLLCSWRTVKEVSLIFGDLVDRLPIRSRDEEDDGILKEERVVEIGNHLSGLLCETKHRGAFEQAFVGYCKVTSTMWRSTNARLHQLPTRWINEILDEISSNENLSSTRRSAGVPFIIQALICTQVKLENKYFHECVCRLLKMAESTTAEPYTPQTVSHALNVLRALFRNSTLGELVSPYVAQGFTVAIHGFNSDSWMVRNSATLLLSSLMSRVFGVPRLKTTVDEISWKNKLTGRLFFQRYPSLFQVLLNHLSTASDNLMYPAIYPVLLILGRLYLSSLEGTDSNLELNKFIPHVFTCSKSAVHKTRALAASAIVPLITPNLFESHLNLIFDEISRAHQENYVHGLLLQVKELFRYNKDLLDKANDKSKWISSITAILDQDDRSHLTKACCLQLLQYASPEQRGQALVLPQKDEHGPGYDEYLSWIARLTLTDNPSIEQFATFLSHSNYDVRGIASEFLIEILSKNDSKFNESEELAMIIARDLSNYRSAHHEDNLKVLKITSLFPLVFKYMSHPSLVIFFATICDAGPASLRQLSFDCLVTFILTYDPSNLTRPEIRKLLKLIWDFSKDEANVECRRSAAVFINKLGPKFHPLLLKEEDYAIQAYHWTVVRLMTDDDDNVRELSRASETVPLRAVENYLAESEGVKLESLLSWAWQSALELHEMANEDDDDEDRVFDKGQANNYLGGALFSCIYKALMDHIARNGLYGQIVTSRVIRLDESMASGRTEFYSPLDSELSVKYSESELTLKMFPLSNRDVCGVILGSKIRHLRSLGVKVQPNVTIEQ